MKLLDWIDKTKLDLFYLSLNPNAISILKEKYDLIDWSMLSRNHNIIKFTKKNINKIDWFNLSSNKNAISILKEHPEFINWQQLSRNKNAIELLKENPEKIRWKYFSTNPTIFTYDYEEMRNSNLDLKEEIIAAALNPKRIFKMIEDYGEEYIYNTYFDD